MREVEAQLVRPHGRAGLTDVMAKPLAARSVQQVRRRVVAGCRVPRESIDHEPRSLPRSELAVLEDERNGLVVSQAVDVLDASPARGAFHHARIGDLAATLRIERALW